MHSTAASTLSFAVTTMISPPKAVPSRARRSAFPSSPGMLRSRKTRWGLRACHALLEAVELGKGRLRAGALKGTLEPLARVGICEASEQESAPLASLADLLLEVAHAALEARRFGFLLVVLFLEVRGATLVRDLLVKSGLGGRIVASLEGRLGPRCPDLRLLPTALGLLPEPVLVHDCLPGAFS